MNHSVIRERYLRTDVSCGIQDCIACPSSAGEDLPALGDGSHSLFPDGHYILPDTNVFLAQVSFPSYRRLLTFEPAIFIRWILSSRIYLRLRSSYYKRWSMKSATDRCHCIIDSKRSSSPKKSGYGFSTTSTDRKFSHFRRDYLHWLGTKSETAIVREEDETPNDRNDRGRWLFALNECTN